MASFQQKRMVEEMVANCHMDEKRARKILQKAKWNLPKAYEIVIGEKKEAGPSVSNPTNNSSTPRTSPKPIWMKSLAFLWSIFVQNMMITFIWTLLLVFFAYCEFGSVFAICSGIFFLFWCTGTRREGEMSAYSVFNKNYEALPGAFESQKMDSYAMLG